MLVAYFHKYDWLCHLVTFIIILVQKRCPSDKANHTCENMLLTIACHSSSLRSLIGDFLASADIKDFGIGLLFIGLAPFSPRVFLFNFL